MTFPEIQRVDLPAWESLGLWKPKIGERVRYRISSEASCPCPNCGLELRSHVIDRVGVGVFIRLNLAKNLRCAPHGCGSKYTSGPFIYGIVLSPVSVIYPGKGSGFWACLWELSPVEGGTQ